MNRIVSKPVVIETMMKSLLLQKTDTQSVPFMMQENRNGVSPLDMAVKENQTVSINLMIEMMVKFFDNENFNYIVDRHFCSLLRKNINLSAYFNTSLPTYKVINSKWPSLHSN
jgi:hypothetical protein